MSKKLLLPIFVLIVIAGLLGHYIYRAEGYHYHQAEGLSKEETIARFGLPFVLPEGQQDRLVYMSDHLNTVTLFLNEDGIVSSVEISYED